MRQLIGWLVISLGVGSVVHLLRYFATWYVLRRVRRALRFNRDKDRAQAEADAGRIRRWLRRDPADRPHSPFDRQ